ncbi:hypothetical protein [Paracoccus sp. NSM]|uniref:hypothetical protein n=1 Tax=Paracoccus sp. NSM TaxID=3457784 RepID=UPI0040356E48
MIGVVVWANASREKAIIWCEDQATLAYLQGRTNLVDAEGRWPEPGDLVELETQTIGNLRHALVVSMLSEQSCPQLPRLLAEAQPEQPEARLRVVNLRDDQRQVVSAGMTLPRMRTSAAG